MNTLNAGLSATTTTTETRMTEAEQELAHLLAGALNLEDRDISSIDPDAPLFGDYGTGWGLDSIDALEIALAVQQHYGVELRAEDDASRKAFASLRELSVFVQGRRAALAPG